MCAQAAAKVGQVLHQVHLHGVKAGYVGERQEPWMVCSSKLEEPAGNPLAWR